MSDFKLREGVTYMRRDGGRSGVIEHRPNRRQEWYDPLHRHFHNDDGHWFHDGEDHDNDLVAVWTEAAPGEPVMLPDAPTEAEMIARLPRTAFCDCMQGPNDPDPKCPDCRGTGTPDFDIKAHIADTAKSIVSGARRSAYGTPEQNFERIAALWSGYATARGWGMTFTAADVSPLMILMKLARLAETPDHLDSAVDLVGYTLTMAEVNGIKKDA